MKSIKVLVCAILVVAGLSACSTNKAEGPTHKAKTSACLVTPATSTPGSPEKQLAFDLVEAKVIYGLNAKEVRTPKNASASQIDTLLLTSLREGCLYFLATDPAISDRVVNFAGNHKYVVALIVGGDAPADQPANVRWIADDLASGAALAGFVSASKSTTDNVRLIVQSGYFEEAKVISSFSSGLKAFNVAANKNVALTVSRVASPAEANKAIQDVSDQVVLAVFAGKAIWEEITKGSAQVLVGSDLQLGSSATLDPRVVVSVERNFNSIVLDTAKDLLDKNFRLEPVLSEKDALLTGLVLLRTKDETVLDGATTDLLNAYKAKLVASRAK
jgi:basic membrane lipoprotein Med (substrate-binding protein (PBP1-ABC) superfamily)